MTLFEGLYSTLNNNSAIATALPGGIVPEYIPEGTTQTPICTIRVISGPPEPPTHDSGPSPIVRARIEITVYGNLIKTCEQTSYMIANLFRSINGYLGTTGNVRFCTISVSGQRSLIDATTRLLGSQIDIIAFVDTSTLS